MRKFINICIPALLLVLSCSKIDREQGQKYTFSVDGILDEMPVDEQATKVTLAHTMQMTWSKGDAVSVVNLTKGMALGGSLTADKAQTVSTFSGTVTGNIENGDVLALIYPSLGYTSEQTFADAVVDFSSQDGTDKNAKFCAVATMTANTAEGNFVEAETHFFMKSGMINITLADLPVSTVINQVSIPGLYSGINLSINSTGDNIVFTGINGTITMTPNSTTSVQGTKGLYFGLGGAAKASARRTVSVICGEDLYESTMTDAAIGAKFYTLSIGAFEKKTLNSGIGLNYDDSPMEDGETVTIGEDEE